MKKIKLKNGSEIEFLDEPPKNPLRSVGGKMCPKTMTGKHHWSKGMYDTFFSCQYCGIFDDR